jgi:hypothetical protein
MTVEIILHELGASEIIDIVSKLRADGCRQGQDFDFAFHRSRWDEMIGDVPSNTRFIFYTEKYASLFSLKYGS